MMSANKPG